MADASSSGEGIEENPIETAISRGASLSEPAEASISRKRKVIVNHGKYKASREQKNLNSKTSVWDRIRDHPGQHLEYVRGQLKCNACHEILAQKKSTVDRHMKSKKHLAGIARITADRKESQTIFQCLQRQDKQENASGTTLPANLRLFRFEVVETLLLAGIPISKVDILRPLLEKYGQRLTSSSHMNDLIPVVLDKEKEKLKAELNIVREASIIFDGTARLGEALAIVVRYVQQDFRPTQRLLRLEVLAKPLKGNELAQRLMTCMAVVNRSQNTRIFHFPLRNNVKISKYAPILTFQITLSLQVNFHLALRQQRKKFQIFSKPDFHFPPRIKAEISEYASNYAVSNYA